MPDGAGVTPVVAVFQGGAEYFMRGVRRSPGSDLFEFWIDGYDLPAGNVTGFRVARQVTDAQGLLLDLYPTPSYNPTCEQVKMWKQVVRPNKSLGEGVPGCTQWPMRWQPKAGACSGGEGQFALDITFAGPVRVDDCGKVIYDSQSGPWLNRYCCTRYLEPDLGPCEIAGRGAYRHEFIFARAGVAQVHASVHDGVQCSSKVWKWDSTAATCGQLVCHYVHRQTNLCTQSMVPGDPTSEDQGFTCPSAESGVCPGWP